MESLSTNIILMRLTVSSVGLNRSSHLCRNMQPIIVVALTSSWYKIFLLPVNFTLLNKQKNRCLDYDWPCQEFWWQIVHFWS